ncbi:MAG TPA: TIR domain-containing protein [Candidatus Angelobacter sp.]
MSEFSFDVFLSHSSRDKITVRRVAEKLRSNGLRVWLDDWAIEPGDDIRMAIEHGLNRSRTMVLCISPAALGSGWINLERETHLFRDPRNIERRLIPLLLAGGTLPDNFRAYQYVDFRQETEEEFKSLLKACRLARPDFENVSEQTHRYATAKVVLVGDSGVGKTALAHALVGDGFENTDSTHGLKVWKLEAAGSNQVRREILLWDLAGQPGYRLIHQLYLTDVAVALVVFDASSEVDPLAGVRHWERALRLAKERHGARSAEVKKFLVSARTDLGGVAVSRDRIDSVLREFGFHGYFETSAKEGWQIQELRQAIEQAIPWYALPETVSSALFTEIRTFLLKVKETGQLVAAIDELCDEFARANSGEVAKESTLRLQFNACIGRLAASALIRTLSFGGYVLLQPELLDTYASAMVNAARQESDGLGSILEDRALTGDFFVPKNDKVRNKEQEQVLLHATVEELVQHDLALREVADDGRYLVFPSQFTREHEHAQEPYAKAVGITFEGPAQSLYSTLVVRLCHSGLFTAGRAEMWRNTAVFTAEAGGKCGLYLQEFDDACGQIIVFYEADGGEGPSDETRLHFEEFALAHAQRHAVDGTVRRVRFFVCSNGHPVPDQYVRLLLDKGKKTFTCPCGVVVSLGESHGRLRYDSRVTAMVQAADRQRDLEMLIESARGETSTVGFEQWAGGRHKALAIVFVDVVASTTLRTGPGSKDSDKIREHHYARSHKLVALYKGREIKSLGDGLILAFHSMDSALSYARELQADFAHAGLKIRIGIHVGPVNIVEGDVFGGTINYVARLIAAMEKTGICLSAKAKDEMSKTRVKQNRGLRWTCHNSIEKKGFSGKFKLWSLTE